MSARFSEMLVNRRRQLGMSVQQVANVIKIRPQIIEYFETGDFRNMPQRGYAQGMISSYARYLGLNPREVIDAYFDDLYAYERETSGTYTGNYLDASTEAVPRRGDSGGYASAQPTGSPGSRYGRRLPQAGYVGSSSSGNGSTGRRSALGQTRGLPSGQRGSYRGEASGSTQVMRRPRTSDPSRAGMTRQGRPQGRPPQGGGRRPSQQRGRAQGRPPARNGRGRASGGLSSNPRVLLAGALALLLVLIIVIVFAVRSCTAAPAENASDQTVPVSQATTVDSGSDEPADEQGSDLQASNDEADASADGTADAQAQQPTEYQVVISVADGQSTWLEVKNGGKTVYADNVVGPLELNYVADESLEISLSNTDAVTLTVNREKTDIDSRSGGIGRRTVAVPSTAANTDENASGESGSDGSASNDASSDSK